MQEKNFASTGVCASAKPGGKCFKKITVAAAKTQCAAVGARLCSAAEVKAKVATKLSKSQCKVHGKRVWTTDSCTDSKGREGTFLTRADGKNAKKDKCIALKSKKSKGGALLCCGGAPEVGKMGQSSSAGAFAAAPSTGESSGSSGSSESGGAGAAVSGTVGAMCVFALVGIAVSRRRSAAAAEEGRAPRASLASTVMTAEEGAPRRDSSDQPLAAPAMMEPDSLESDNGFVLDHSGNLRIASVKRGNPMYRNSVYVGEEDEIGEAGVAAASEM